MNVIKAMRLYGAVKPFLEYLEKNDMNGLIKNWKTTLAALMTAISIAGPMLGFMSPDQSHYLQGFAAVFGLAAAKDSNVTGGTKQQ